MTTSTVVPAVAAALASLLTLPAPPASASDQIPKAAWRRPMGQPLDNPGKKKPSINGRHIDDGYWQGAPVGGFGAGTFSRSYRGDFVRWHLKAGVHKYETVPANQFAMFQQAQGGPAKAVVLYAGKPAGNPLPGWSWTYPVGAGEYAALYPKSWFDHKPQPDMPARVVVEQFSPILPDNYKESSYPVALYTVHASNPSNRPVTVSVLLSWTNMVGWFRDTSTGFQNAINLSNRNAYRAEPLGGGAVMKGIVFDRLRRGPVTEDWDGQFAIAAAESPGVEVTTLTDFVAQGRGDEVWKPFAKDGRLPGGGLGVVSAGEPLAGAIAARFTLAAGQRRDVRMVLSWDLPVAQFGGGAKWHRKYTEFFGTSGTNAWAIAKTGLQQGDGWSAAIDKWQKPYVEDRSKPLWYRGMLWNELYALADLGTVWARPIDAAPATPWTFGYLECFDYAYYETMDVRFYGSMPLIKFWPEIDKGVMRAFADTVPRAWTEKQLWNWKTNTTGQPAFRLRKSKGAVPHDLGSPREDPFVFVNQFSWQNTDRWKDLNSKFVLLVWRDYVFSGRKDIDFLRATWPATKEALAYLLQFDTNGDGLPENEGFPDQTYDTWPVKGESAYCGGLYLAALRAAEEIAKIIGPSVGEPDAVRRYHDLFVKGQQSYLAKLWNGEYFRYDTQSEHSDDIQSDQLAGQWYASLTGLGDIVPPKMQQSALQKIFALNVMKFKGGQLGAVNGIRATGEVRASNEQVGEVWTGVTFGVASHMLLQGLRDEAFKTAWGIYAPTYERLGYWFRTPEAWDETGDFRASMYMRPGAVWAMEMKPPAPSR
jgi:non-lysosomal glucosylceramidase